MIKMFMSCLNAADRIRPPVRPAIVLLALCLGAAGWHGLAPTARAAQGRTPTLKEIGDGIKAQWDRIASLRVDHEKKMEGVAPDDVIKRYSLLIALGGMEETFAFKGSKRYYRSVDRPIVRTLAPDVDHDYDAIPGGKEIKKRLEDQRASLGLPRKLPLRNDKAIAATKSHPFEVGFDGKDFHQREPSGHAMVLDVKTMPGFGGSFMQNYLRNLDRVLPDPVGSPEDAKRHCFPEVPLPAGFEVRPTLEDFGGAHCVVVEDRGRERIWFDPATNFGVRKHEILDPDTGIVAERRVNTDFAEVSRGIWLPKTCYREICGPPSAPPTYRGKPLYRDVYLVSRISINDVPDSLFVVEITPGEQVFDATRAPGKGDKNRFVVYKMPADASQIDEAVSKALADEAERRAGEGRTRSIWYGVLTLNLAIIAVVAVTYTRKKKVRE
jgi:hypothetical protein